MVLSSCFWALSNHKVANAFYNTNLNKVCQGLTQSHINQGSTGAAADNARHWSDSGPIEMFTLYFLCPRYDDIMTDTVNKLFVDNVDSMPRGGGVTWPNWKFLRWKAKMSSWAPILRHCGCFTELVCTLHGLSQIKDLISRCTISFHCIVSCFNV